MSFVRSTSQLHHKPVVTLGLVLVCLITGIASFAAGSTSVNSFALSYGDGLHPLQWLTSFFVQTNLLYLFASLVFLGMFGVLIEGKLGAAKFLLVFLVLMIGASAIEQLIMQSSSGGIGYNGTTVTAADVEKMSATEAAAYLQSMNHRRSTQMTANVGSSTALCGMLVMCVLWAPASIFQLGGSEEEPLTTFPLMGFVLLFAIWSGAKFFMSGMTEGGHPVHLIGMFPGMILAIGLLATRHAQCEGEDLMSVMGGSKNISQTYAKGSINATVQTGKMMETHAQRKAQAMRDRRDREDAARQKAAILEESKRAAPKNKKKPKIDASMERVTEAFQAGKHVEAIRFLNDVDPDDHDSLKVLTLQQYEHLTRSMLEKQCWFAAAMILEKSVEAYPDDSNERRLILGQVYLILEQPGNCRQMLSKVRRQDFNEKEQARYRELVMRLRATEAA